MNGFLLTPEEEENELQRILRAMSDLYARTCDPELPAEENKYYLASVAYWEVLSPQSRGRPKRPSSDYMLDLRFAGRRDILMVKGLPRAEANQTAAEEYSDYLRGNNRPPPSIDSLAQYIDRVPKPESAKSAFSQSLKGTIRRTVD